MERAQKEASVEQIGKAFEGATASFIVDYKGYSCDELTAIRKELRDVGASFSVVKNTLAKIAINDTSADGLKEFLSGPTAVVWSCLLYTSPSPRDQRGSRMPSSA